MYVLCMWVRTYVCMVLIQWFELQPNQSQSFVGRILNWVLSVCPLDTNFHARRSIFCDSSLYLPLGHAAIWLKLYSFDFMIPECFLSPAVYYSFLPGFYEWQQISSTILLSAPRFLARFDISNFLFSQRLNADRHRNHNHTFTVTRLKDGRSSNRG